MQNGGNIIFFFFDVNYNEILCLKNYMYNPIKNWKWNQNVLRILNQKSPIWNILLFRWNSYVEILPW